MSDWLLDNEPLTQEDLAVISSAGGWDSVDEFIETKTASGELTAGKTNDVAETGAPVASETPAPGSGVSFSDDISLDVPETKLEPGDFGKYVF